MEIKFGPSSLITIESSGYARPFDRTPVEEHTCMHPRKDVEGLVTAPHLSIVAHCHMYCNCTTDMSRLLQSLMYRCNHSDMLGFAKLTQVHPDDQSRLPSLIPSFVGQGKYQRALSPCMFANDKRKLEKEKILPWITGLYTHTEPIRIVKFHQPRASKSILYHI